MSTVSRLGKAPRAGSPLEVFLVALKLGLTSFGGPVAHLGYFRQEYVVRRKWLDDQTYADLVALGQFLPGPASSQVGIAVGTVRAGILGGLAAWLGFTMPSAIALIAFAYGVTAIGGVADAGWLHGLKVAAVAVVAVAVWGMGRSFCADARRATIAIVAAVVTLALATAWVQVLVIAVAGAAGLWMLPPSSAVQFRQQGFRVGAAFGAACLALFFLLLIALPLVRQAVSNQPLAVFDGFYRSGSLVFGGGHVVLPLLQQEVVPTGWVTNDRFLAGYGAAQAVPGPLFTFSAYLGAVMTGTLTGWAGGLFALGAIFLPAYLLIAGAMPFWDRLRSVERFRSALNGINAAVVGILLAALYHPVWTSAITAPADFALGLAAFGLLAFWRWPPWTVVVLAALGGEAVARV